MARVDIRGVIIPNSYKWFYDWFDEDSTCPRDVQKVVDALKPGEVLDVYVNSPGGVISSGSEIYTLLRGLPEDTVRIHITGEACSAASVISMAGWSEMAPTALMMVHCVSSYVGGNHLDMEHMAETLRTADQALSTAYMAKTGMTDTEALEMMEHETWLTAQQAKDKGLIDQIMFDEPEEAAPMVAGPLFRLPTMEQMERVKALMAEQEAPTDEAIDHTSLDVAKAGYNLLCLKERRN